MRRSEFRAVLQYFGAFAESQPMAPLISTVPAKPKPKPKPRQTIMLMALGKERRD
jgi:hypothetical protein